MTTRDGSFGKIAMSNYMDTVVIVLVFVAFLFSGCPGPGEETAPGDPETCCACLYDAFPAVGEPCIYESANSCQGHVKAGVGPDTWGICLAELCGDVCDGVGPFDVIRWEP